MDKQELKSIVQTQQEQNRNLSHEVLRTILPDISAYIALPHAIIICGLRRDGKSVFLHQIEKHYYPAGGYYFNFEDERLINFTVEDFHLLHEVFIELQGEKKVFFFDEIQNIPGWEIFVRRLINEGYKFFITGSNASMLSQELGTRLTGRHIMVELFPYSFLEYLVFKKQTYDPKMLLVTSKKIKLKQHFNLFLKQGGMPEYVLYEQAEVLTRNYEDILYRDIITRYKIKDIMAFRRLSLYLFNNFSTRITYNSLGPLVKIANTSTISNYIHYLENSYLIFTVKQFSYSVKQQLLLPKKIYVIDNGMAEVVSINFSENKGRYLENTVFLELKRRYKEIYYYQTQGNKEVDFVIFEKGKAKYLIQVCYHLNANAGKTKEREVAALVEAMKELKIHEALILTEDEREDIINDKNTIFVRPVYEWLLESIRFLV